MQKKEADEKCQELDLQREQYIKKLKEKLKDPNTSNGTKEAIKKRLGELLAESTQQTAVMREEQYRKQ